MLTSKHQSHSQFHIEIFLRSFVLIAESRSSLSVFTRGIRYFIHIQKHYIHVYMCTNNNLELLLEVVPMFSCKVKQEDIYIYGFQHAAQNSYAQK